MASPAWVAALVAAATTLSHMVANKNENGNRESEQEGNFPPVMKESQLWNAKMLLQ